MGSRREGYKQLNYFMPEDVYNRLERIAKREWRSIAQMITYCCERWMDEHYPETKERDGE